MYQEANKNYTNADPNRSQHNGSCDDDIDYMNDFPSLKNKSSEEQIKMLYDYDLMCGGHYSILGVPPGSRLDIIKKVYRRKVLRCHPDKNDHPSAKAEFLKLQEAYEKLTGPGRLQYHKNLLAKMKANELVDDMEKESSEWENNKQEAKGFSSYSTHYNLYDQLSKHLPKDILDFHFNFHFTHHF